MIILRMEIAWTLTLHKTSKIRMAHKRGTRQMSPRMFQKVTVWLPSQQYAQERRDCYYNWRIYRKPTVYLLYW